MRAIVRHAALTAVLIFGPGGVDFGAQPLRPSLPPFQKHNSDVPVLVPGKVIDQELKGGEVNRFQIRLKARQFLDLSVEQQGIDVVVRLLGPGGKQLIEVDSPNGPDGPEPVVLIVNQSGTYTLEIEAPDPAASTGKYQVKCEPLHRATPQDQKRARQIQAGNEFNRLLNEGTALRQAGKYQNAQAVLQQAVTLAEQIFGPEHMDTAAAYNNLADVFASTDDFSKAESLYKRALAICEKIAGPEHLDTAITLNNLGQLYKSKGDFETALRYYQRSSSIIEKALGPEHPQTGAMLNNLGMLYRAMGKTNQAEQLLQRTLEIWEKTLGPEHPQTITCLNNLAGLCLVMGNYDRSLKLYQQVVVLREKVLGPNHPETAVSLNELATLLRIMGKYEQAEPLFRRSLASLEKSLGPEHSLIAKALNDGATLYSAKGDFAQAEALYQRALTMNEHLLGKDHPSVASTLNNLALLYRTKGEYVKAESLFERSLKIDEKALGPDHPGVSATLSNLAGLYKDMGEFKKAEVLYQRSLTISEKTQGSTHPETAASINNLAELYRELGDYPNAETLFQRSLTIFETALGEDHPETANIYTNLAGIHMAQGDFAQAEPLYQRALAILEKKLGPFHPEVARTLNNLATVYRYKGDFQQAEVLHRRSLAIIEQAFGPDHPSVASALNNLAMVLLLKHEYPEAEPLLRRGQAIREKNFGKDHPDVAASLGTLANLMVLKGDLTQAEFLNEQALAIREKTFGTDHPDIALTLLNLGNVYRVKGNFARAEAHLTRALAIVKTTLGPDHPQRANCLSKLALMSLGRNQVGEAIRYQAQCGEIRERDLLRNLVTGSESQKISYLKLTQNEVDTALSLNQQFAPKSSEAAQSALTMLLRRKGRALDAATNAIEIVRQRATPEDRKILDELFRLRSQISVLTLRGPGKDSSQRYLATLKALNEQAEQLEAQISARSVEFKVQTTPITLESIQKLIPADAALVEFALYHPYDPKTDTFNPPHYAVYVLKNQGSGTGNQGSGFRVQGSGPETQGSGFRVQGSGLDSTKNQYSQIQHLQPVANHKDQDQRNKTENPEPGTRNPEPGFSNPEPGTLLWADLGEASEIEPVIKAFRQELQSVTADPGRRLVLGSGQSSKKPRLKELGRKLEKLIFQPVRHLLGAKTRVLLSPDGSLNLIPFDALVDEQGKYLVERYEFSYLTSGRDLLRLQSHIPSEQPPLIIANPDYAKGKGPALFGLQFEPLTRLEGTEREAQQLKATFPQSVVYLDRQATKSVLTLTHRPLFLHISTHGAFLEDQATGPDLVNDQIRLLERTDESRGLVLQSFSQTNPLLRSCLFFAGANQPTTKTNNGVLTALEVAGLDLWGTRLVVLSACDSGLGDIKTRDGVYGLRRALVLAGAESQLVSLWPVSDAGTQELMSRYYQLLKTGVGRSAALRQVRLELLKNPVRRHPYYWASFILSGDWKPL
ncbi:MAG: tetratricopeptide repeat protein [Acidobacteria bacterium]|nr:tetratricopeptide repeat protein [Acidobacteriota bacterium]